MEEVATLKNDNLNEKQINALRAIEAYLDSATETEDQDKKQRQLE
jgi:hypothetical protein